MTKNLKIFLVLCLAAFFILGIYLVVAVSNISISYSDGGYHGGINEDYLAVRIAEEMSKQQQNLFSSVKEELQSPDMDTFTAELIVTALPREFSEATTATLSTGEHSVLMEKKDGVFVGSVKIPLDEKDGEYRILLRDGNQYRSQVFPLEMAGFVPGYMVFEMEHWGMSSSGPDTSYTLEQGFELNETLLPFGEKAVSARVFALDEGEEIYTEPLINGQLKISKRFELRIGMPVSLYGEAMGKSGLIYRYRLLDMQRPVKDNIDVNVADSGTDLLQVITPEGKTIDLPVEGY